MPERRQSRVWIVGVLGLGVVGGLGYMGYRASSRKPAAVQTVAQKVDKTTPAASLVPLVREGNAAALAALYERVTEDKDVARDEDSKLWIDALDALRSGYRKYNSYGRATAMNAAVKILNKYSVSAGGTAPPTWVDVLAPVHDILSAGMVDSDLNVRASALGEVARLWSWLPGRQPIPREEDLLAEWKQGLHTPTVRCLGDKASKVRVAAVACLGLIPIDAAAAPAVAYLEDMGEGGGEVRKQVLSSFGGRRNLLTDEALLKRLYDPEPGIPDMAQLVLRTRGLTDEQISLGKLVYHPKAALRASVIPLLRDRTDIDPIVWFLMLTRDPESSVRASAVEALASRLSPEVRSRLSEMAATDKSPEVREAASKIVPPAAEKTASLPPLPGSPSLNPKAN